MRLITAEEFSYCFQKTKEYLTELKEGIILLSEGSLDHNKHNLQDWTIKDIAKYTSTLPMTIIGETEGRVHIIKKGKISKAQFSDTYQVTQSTYELFDKIINVSYNNKNVKALMRVCGDALEPHHTDEKIDLLLIPTGGVDWEEKENLEHLLYVHEKNFKNTTLIAQSDQHRGNKFIYSVKEQKMIGTNYTAITGAEYILQNIMRK